MNRRGPIRYTWSGDAAIAYQIVGDGPQDLLYLPGWGSNLDVRWQLPEHARFLDRLGSFARLISVDRRGRGCSDRVSPDEHVPLEQHVEDLLRVIDAVGTDRVSILAVETSSYAAVQTAISYPDLLGSLVLYRPIVRGVGEGPAQIPPDQYDAFVRSLRAMDSWDDWTRVFVRDTNPTLAGNERIVAGLASLMRCTSGPGSLSGELFALRELDLDPVLPQVRAPTLVLSRPASSDEAHADALHVVSRIPGAELRELPGVDGYAWADGSDAFLEEVQHFLTGSRRLPAPERVLTTVLFTDLVDSTAAAAGLGDAAWRELLERHHAVARATLRAHRGSEVDTAGDGFFATFEQPARAVACATELADLIGELGLQVRIGLHTGEVEVIDGKVGGLAVVIGSRIASTADAGQVLVSQTVRDLVVGSELSFDDAGEHELKGIPGRWHLYRVAT